MTRPPTITASVTFLAQAEGGRSKCPKDSPLYRPHLVIGNPNHRVALTDEHGDGVEHYLGVQFTGKGTDLVFGVEHKVTLKLIYHANVDYSALREGATFTIREGGRIVSFGRVA